jgi:hypothetical protein
MCEVTSYLFAQPLAVDLVRTAQEVVNMLKVSRRTLFNGLNARDHDELLGS